MRITPHYWGQASPHRGLLKLSSQVDSAKLRGGFYSPASLVAACWSRVDQLTGSRTGLRALEPSAGDGAFIRGLSAHNMRTKITTFDAVELLEEEATKAAQELQEIHLEGIVLRGSFLQPEANSLGDYDVTVGNPPFLRYQFIDANDLAELHSVEARAGVSFGRVANLWIPVFLSAVSRLKDGGVFSFILPSEFLTGISGAAVRTWLTRNASDLSIDTFPARSFPGVLQEIILVSGRRTKRPSEQVTLTDHASDERHRHQIREDDATWTGFTLTPLELSALRSAKQAQFLLPMGEVARLSVSTVTGANSFFTYDESTRERYKLERWSRKLLARTRHAPGLNLTEKDWEVVAESRERSWLLDTKAPLSALNDDLGLLSYLAIAEAEDIPLRFKTRTRKPWYGVPVVEPKELLLAKRSHQFPRLIANSARVTTTDTIYQGSLAPQFHGMASRVVAGFHNSLTLLTAEIEGRSFGGGVLELVPSEISRLSVINPQLVPDALGQLDDVARVRGYESEAVISATNDMLLNSVPALESGLLVAAESARRRLLERRLARN